MDLYPVPITAKDLPFCIVPKDKLLKLKDWINETYDGLNASFDLDKDLAIVWITGFKPKGDDSRPDRGLSPLCRMILGKDANIMAVVSGPAKQYTWNKLINSPNELCENNGLFEAIFTCCNYLFVDSATCNQKIFIHTKATLNKNTSSIKYHYTQNPSVNFFENDVDCAIHQILSTHNELGIFECFCNPPGGDWSGVLFYMNNKEYKWTSLPRVSDQNKRPDHLFQIKNKDVEVLVTIESKGYGKDLEDNIGERLKDYIRDLFKSEPTAIKKDVNSEWEYFNGSIGKFKYALISVGAFLYNNEQELKNHLVRGKLDAVLAFEFGNVTKLHFYSNERGKFILYYLNKISIEQTSFIIQVH